MALLCAFEPVSMPGVTVTGRVVVTSPSKQRDSSPVVVWLTPMTEVAVPIQAQETLHPRSRLVQKNKEFNPHLLVVPVGATVEFPNLDPFFHNVFSLFEGKRFDLGLYEAGSTRAVRFDRPGICYIFCNIHPEMSAVILVMKTPYYAVSDAGGAIRIQDVPPGRYRLEAWQEAALPAELKELRHEITVSSEASFLGTLHIHASRRSVFGHKNKYGRDYDEPVSPNPLYENPR